MKKEIPTSAGMSTIAIHHAEHDNSLGALLTPVYQTAAFGFDQVDSVQRIMSGEQPGYLYSRSANPNVTQLEKKYASLEGLDLLRSRDETEPEGIVAAKVVSSGMAAISAAVIARARSGDSVIVQRELYGNAFAFWKDLAPRLGINVVWIDARNTDDWEKAFRATSGAVLAYTETPANPTLSIVDLSALSDIAHGHEAWVFADNTLASPYHQRPLTWGTDVVLHSTTKFLSGHGQIIGGTIVSRHVDFINEDVKVTTKLLGQAPSPFDSWLAYVGLKTFEIRMERHASNGKAVADFLASHPKVSQVYYPGLPTHPGNAIARRQMVNGYGSIVSFELKGGYDAAVTLIDNMQLATCAVSLGNVASLIEHPASMTHFVMPQEERRKAGISEGLVRFSVGTENIEDLLEDTQRALDKIC